jgi:4-aminobutyrate aminotransferase
MYACLEMGLSFKVSHGSFLTLTPPLTISDNQLDHALSILEKAFQTL